MTLGGNQTRLRRGVVAAALLAASAGLSACKLTEECFGPCFMPAIEVTATDNGNGTTTVTVKDTGGGSQGGTMNVDGGGQHAQTGGEQNGSTTSITVPTSTTPKTITVTYVDQGVKDIKFITLDGTECKIDHNHM